MADRTQTGEDGAGPYGRRSSPGESPIEIRRHLDALRRSRRFIILFVLVTTAAALTASLLFPKTYRAVATVVLAEQIAPFGSSDVETVKRRLETIERLLRTPTVLEQAAAGLPDETKETLESKVASSVDQDANIISVAAVDDEPARAAAIANAVANAFLERQRQDERERLQRAQAALEEELARLRSAGGLTAEIEAIRQRISELSVSEAGIGSDLQLAQAAEVPTDPYSPRPVRNTILAFLAASFLGVLIALGRDLLVPRISGPRELTRLTDLPVLVGVPYIRRRFGRSPRMLNAIAHEAYQTLQASLRFQLPPTEQQVVLITSGVEGEGKTNVTAGLGRALARVGQKTLLVCADMRFPTLHERFEIDREPGLSDILRQAARDGSVSPEDIAALVKNPSRGLGDAATNLHVLTAGKRAPHPAQLLFGGPLDAVFAAIGQMDYDYVLVDAPPLLGIADSHALAQRVDSLLLVSRLDRLSLENVVEVRDLLERLEVKPLGLVVIGARSPSAYAYAGSGLGVDES